MELGPRWEAVEATLEFPMGSEAPNPSTARWAPRPVSSLLSVVSETDGLGAALGSLLAHDRVLTDLAIPPTARHFWLVTLGAKEKFWVRRSPCRVERETAYMFARIHAST